MKILPVTRLTYNDNKSIVKYQSPTFKAGSTPFGKLDLSKFGGLREQLNRQMEDPKTRNLFLAICAAGASVLTDIMAGDGKIPDNIEELYKKIVNLLTPKDETQTETGNAVPNTKGEGSDTTIQSSPEIGHITHETTLDEQGQEVTESEYIYKGKVYSTEEEYNNAVKQSE